MQSGAGREGLTLCYTMLDDSQDSSRIVKELAVGRDDGSRKIRAVTPDKPNKLARD